MFIAYPKIHRLGKEETTNILDHEVIIEEKIDGANTSIWREEYDLHFASRTQEKTEGFNGFVDYVKNNTEIQELLMSNVDYRLFGEWLVRHTVAYNELSYRKFYLFDIMVGDEFLDPAETLRLADKYGVPRPQQFFSGKTTEAEIMEFVGKSNLGDKGEGVVIKAKTFINSFGDHVYAKIVTQNFKEENAITFGGNNKHSDTYWEMYVVNKYATLARVKKIMNKIEPTLERKFDLIHIPRITNTCYHDMITEEIWEIQEKVPLLDFKQLKRLAVKKFVQIYKDILSGDISVADEEIK